MLRAVVVMVLNSLASWDFRKPEDPLIACDLMFTKRSSARPNGALRGSALKTCLIVLQSQALLAPVLQASGHSLPGKGWAQTKSVWNGRHLPFKSQGKVFPLSFALYFPLYIVFKGPLN